MAGSIITLSEGSEMTAEFRKAYPNASKAVYYTADVYEELLAQSGCVGIRIYFGIDENDKLNTVLVGVDREGNDLYLKKIYERALVCPPYCSSKNPLNS